MFLVKSYMEKRSEKMRQYDLIIFDCDGVLVDSESLAHDLELSLLKSWGLELEPAVYESLVLGKTQKEIYALLEAKFQERLPKNFRETHESELLKALSKNLKPIEGMKDLLDHLSLPKAVASNSDAERLALALSVTGLFSSFDPHIYSFEVVGKGKPDPALHLHVAKQFDVEPDRCLVIEDSPTGAQGALNAGMDVLGFIQPHLEKGVTASGLKKLPCVGYAASAQEILKKIDFSSQPLRKQA